MAVPRYKTVPPEWQHPLGPYRQAPPEYGGEWWLVNFFTTEEPWVKYSQLVAGPDPAFVAVFGPLPARSDPFFQEWRDNQKYFKGVKLPEYITQAEVNAADFVYEAWGMGKAVIYEGRYGFSARWPASHEYDFDWDARGAVAMPHQVVAVFQIRQAQEGKTPAKWHPFVPPQVYSEENPQ